MSYAYQWKRCDAFALNCLNVSGATGQSYTSTSADVGDTLRVAVSAVTQRARRRPSRLPQPWSRLHRPAPRALAPTSRRSPRGRQASRVRIPIAPPQSCATPGSRARTTTRLTTPSPPTPLRCPGARSELALLAELRRQPEPGHGNFTGTTTEIFQWAACKWGIDEDTLRAVAVQESDWHQSAVGDNCGVVGEASYGNHAGQEQDLLGSARSRWLSEHRQQHCPERRLLRRQPPLLLRRRLLRRRFLALRRQDGRPDRGRQRLGLRALGLHWLLVLRRLVRLGAPSTTSTMSRPCMRTRPG